MHYDHILNCKWPCSRAGRYPLTYFINWWWFSEFGYFISNWLMKTGLKTKKRWFKKWRWTYELPLFTLFTISVLLKRYCLCYASLTISREFFFFFSLSCCWRSHFLTWYWVASSGRFGCYAGYWVLEGQLDQSSLFLLQYFLELLHIWCYLYISIMPLH